MSDLKNFLPDVLRLTGQNLLAVPNGDIIARTAVFRADLSRRPDVRGWLDWTRRGLDTEYMTSWVCWPDNDPPLALLVVAARKPQFCRFIINLALSDADAWRWIERIARAGYVGLTDRQDARDPQDRLSTTVLIPFRSQPLDDLLEAVR